MLTFIPAFRRFVKRFSVALILCIVFSGIGIGAVNAMINSRFANLKRTNANVADDTAKGEPANFLLIGSDTRDFVKTADEKGRYTDANGESGQRSDTMMIIHVDPKNKKTTIMAIPRDTVVNVPGIGKTKINAAFNQDLGGGIDRLIETIDVNFDVPIHHYINMDFKSFQEIVKAVGDVNVYFPYPARDKNSGLDTQGRMGCLGLDGPLALAYVRSRYYEELKNGKWVEDPTSGVGRIKRQQEFMKRVASIAIRESLADPLAGRDVVDGVAKHLEVDQNFDKNAIFKLMNAFKGVDPNDPEHLLFETLPVESKYQNGSWNDIVIQDQAEAMLEELRSFSTEKKDDKPTVLPKAETVNLRIINTTTQKGLAASVAQEFTTLGFKPAGTGNSAKVAQSEIHYTKASKAKAQLVATYVNAKLVLDNSLVDADVALFIGSDFSGVKDTKKASSTVTTQADEVTTTTSKSQNTNATQANDEAECKA